MTMAERPVNSPAQSDACAWGRRMELGIRRGLALKSSSVRTSTRTGQCAVPIRRESLSTEIVLIDDMMRPHLLRDAMLWHVASWGDRNPHGRRNKRRAPVCQDRLSGGAWNPSLISGLEAAFRTT